MNCATELADLFTGWAPGGATPYNRRLEFYDRDAAAMWRGQTHAAMLLREIDRTLEALRSAGLSTAGFDLYVSEWHAGLFSVNSPWTTPTGNPVVRDEALAALRSMALLLDVNALPPTDERRKSSLLAVLDEATALLGESGDHLSDPEREYLWRLLDGARDYLAEVQGRGTADLREHLDRVTGAMVGLATRMAADGDQTFADRLFGLAVRFAAAGRTTLYDAAAVATILGVAVQVQGALGH